MEYISSDISIQSMLEELNINKTSESHVVKQTAKLGETIFDSNKQQTSILFIVSGLAKKINTDYQNEFIINLLKTGNVIGLYNGLTNHAQMEERVIAITACTFISIDREYLLNYLAIRPSFMELLIKEMSNTIAKTHNRMMYLSNLSRENRVAASMLELSKEIGINEGDHIIFPKAITKKILSDYSRVEYRYFQKLFSKMKTEHLIDSRGPRIEVNQDLLEEHIGR
ncbi:Crp/Fnr family transcriptional regulator [Listeria fleischmannii]|nr:Crp/Fnr family transcriptional regulator [Listeria fleischmannii]EMG26755.1 CarD family transcriptional regulator [Listeria fleischmannii subsp. fleischmannii LU2006-1]